jgi:hypothetical protein
MGKRKDERAWTSLDDVDYEDETEGANPMPDDDGHVVLKRKEASDAERGRDNAKGRAARKAAPRRTGTNARKATRPRK